jgi:hypothetical protein
VTETILDLYVKDPFLQKQYYFSDISCSTFESYGVVLLSKIPFVSLELVELPSTMERVFLCGTLAVNNELDCILSFLSLIFMKIIIMILQRNYFNMNINNNNNIK